LIKSDTKLYRSLQRHLDRQAVGFPSTISGADLRFLKRMFTPEEAELARTISYKPTPEAKIIEKAASRFTAAKIKQLLENMFAKGSIGWKSKDEKDHWFVMPMVIGMYEAQAGNPTKDFTDDAHAYMKTMSFGRSFITASPPQMRTVPINRSIEVEHHIAAYDDIREVINKSAGPFVALKCICRVTNEMNGNICKQTTREETCMGLNDMAASLIRRGLGRKINKEEALRILEMNQDDGLVLQPGNARTPEFICSCCGCCCGMLRLQKMLPYPNDFWATNYMANISADACTGCGICADRCQVNAVTVSDKLAAVNLDRCIGCGVCVPTCPSGAISLKKKERETVPPANEEELNDKIMVNKKNTLAQWLVFWKAMFKIRQK
jgi:Na+-translocating ferredoxin:NAD+ oxidoreductase subunit B